VRLLEILETTRVVGSTVAGEFLLMREEFETI
jgi:hypothetical protein